MQDFLNFAERFWSVTSLILGGIGTSILGFIKWRHSKKEAERTSTEMLYEQLELLKQKVILQVAREVEQATELAEKTRIITEFAKHCPDCYEKFMVQYNSLNKISDEESRKPS